MNHEIELTRSRNGRFRARIPALPNTSHDLKNARDAVNAAKAAARIDLAAPNNGREPDAKDSVVTFSLSATGRLLLLESDIQDGAEKHCDSPALNQVKRPLPRGPAGSPEARRIALVEDAVAEAVRSSGGPGFGSAHPAGPHPRGR